MLIEKLHGLNATTISLNERFTLLSSAAAERSVIIPRRRQPVLENPYQNLNFRNLNLIEQITRRLEEQAQRVALRQRLGFNSGRLKRAGSESNLGLWRSNSFDNLSQASFRSRGSWNQNRNFRRSSSFSDLSAGSWQWRPKRRNRRRNNRQGPIRGRFGGPSGGQPNGGQPWQRPRKQQQGNHQNQAAKRGNTNRGRGNGMNRGVISHTQTSKTLPTKEELDAELDQYMASSKAALDKELDAYMESAMECE